jgi:hypothetical protein
MHVAGRVQQIGGLMPLVSVLLLVATVSVVVSLIQWFLTRRLHMRAFAAVRSRHQHMQRISDELLKHCRRQVADLQQELAAATAVVHRPAALPRPEPVVPIRVLQTQGERWPDGPQWFADTTVQQPSASGLSRPAWSVNAFSDTVQELPASSRTPLRMHAL